MVKAAMVPILSMNDFKRDAGLRLRLLIEMLDLKQTEAADLMGVSKHTLQNWLDGDSPPQPYPMYRLARLRNVDFNWVMLGDHTALRQDLAAKVEAAALAMLEDQAAQAQKAT